MTDSWTMRTRPLAPLKVGDSVFIQNQEGNYPRRWDKRGQVVKVKGYDQYIVRVDGSRRLTRRNRKFLRKFEQYRPDGMNAQQAQTPQEGLSGKGSCAIAREEPLQQPDQPPTSMRETPRTTPQAMQLQQENGNDKAPQEPEEPVQAPASPPRSRSTRAGRGTTRRFDDYVRLED